MGAVADNITFGAHDRVLKRDRIENPSFSGTLSKPKSFITRTSPRTLVNSIDELSCRMARWLAPSLTGHSFSVSIPLLRYSFQQLSGRSRACRLIRSLSAWLASKCRFRRVLRQNPR
jgi:hypothetical protein